MSKMAIRLLMLAVCGTALAAVPMVTPDKAEASGRAHIKKHKRQMSRGFSGPRSAAQAWPVARPSSQAGEVCPGIARSFECKIWPPPFNDDPDRKMSGSDGG